MLFVFFFKQKTAYERRISDWSSDVCSSDLGMGRGGDRREAVVAGDAGDGAAQPGQLGAGLGDRLALAGANLDLRAQELRGDALAELLLAAGHQAVGRIDYQVARLTVDQEVLLLHADGEARFRPRSAVAHARPPPLQPLKGAGRDRARGRAAPPPAPRRGARPRGRRPAGYR